MKRFLILSMVGLVVAAVAGMGLAEQQRWGRGRYHDTMESAHWPEDAKAPAWEHANRPGDRRWGGSIRGGQMRGGRMWGGHMHGGQMHGGQMCGGRMFGGRMHGGQMHGGHKGIGGMRGKAFRAGIKRLKSIREMAAEEGATKTVDALDELIAKRKQHSRRGMKQMRPWFREQAGDDDGEEAGGKHTGDGKYRGRARRAEPEPETGG